MIVIVVVPVLHLFETGRISKRNHIVDLSPSVLTNPAIAARVIIVHSDIQRVAIAAGWRTLPIVVLWKIVAAHHLCERIGPGQHERVGDLVVSALTERQNAAAAAMATLVIVIVNEGNRITARNECPRFTEILQVFHFLTGLLVDHFAQLHAILKLGYSAQVCIICVLDRLAAKIDYLLKYERSLVVTKNSLEKIRIKYYILKDLN